MGEEETWRDLVSRQMQQTCKHQLIPRLRLLPTCPGGVGRSRTYCRRRSQKWLSQRRWGSRIVQKPAWRRGIEEHRYTGEQDGRKKDAGLARAHQQRVHKAGGSLRSCRQWLEEAGQSASGAGRLQHHVSRQQDHKHSRLTSIPAHERQHRQSLISIGIPSSGTWP